MPRLTEQPAATPQPSASGGPTVTAIVSVYKASRFLRGCLDDLLAQSLHARGELEVVVVDTGSPEDEGAITREYQARSPHVRYLRTEDRRTIYAAWNLGLAAATGRYLTNANSDDRHHPEALERLAAALDARPEVDLAYADTVWTPVENEILATTTSRLRVVWPAFSVSTLRGQCMVGPQPMWRRAIHARYGVFDDRYTSAGDWEFWLRMAAPGRFLKIDEVLGLYLINQGGAELGNPRARAEADQVRQRFGIRPEELAQRARFESFDRWATRDRPAVSVLVTRGGGLEDQRLASASVALQDEPDWELVLIGPDPGGEAATLVAQLRARRPGARIRQVDCGAGPVADAWNAGLAAAEGRWILPLQPGTLLAPRLLRSCLAALEAEPSAAVVTTPPPDGAGAAASGLGAALIHRAVFAGGGRFQEGAGGAPALQRLLEALGARGVRAVKLAAPLTVPSPLQTQPGRPAEAAPGPAEGPKLKFRVTQGR